MACSQGKRTTSKYNLATEMNDNNNNQYIYIYINQMVMPVKYKGILIIFGIYWYTCCQ